MEGKVSWLIPGIGGAVVPDGPNVKAKASKMEHAEALRDFPELTRHDPFDRLLVAQASRAGLQLLTADHVLLGLGRDFIIDASR